MASMISSSLGQVGQAIQNAPGELYQASGLQNLAQGLQSLFTGSGGGDEAGYLQSLGQPVPQGVDLVGPSETFTGPGFFESFLPGMQGKAQQYANPSPGTQLGQGLGELVRMLEKIKQGGGGGLPPMVRTPGSSGPTGVQILPGYAQASAPQGGLIHNLIKSYTFGLLNSQLGGVASIGGR
jgi:hypothetical protein